LLLPITTNIINFFVEAVEKTLTVTVINPNTVNTNAAKLPSVEDDNTKATARAVAEHTIDKAVGLTIGKTNLNTTYKTIGTKAALLLVFITTSATAPTKTTVMDFLPALLTVRIYKLRVLIYRLSFATTSTVLR
jgi:hypothetical protein